MSSLDHLAVTLAIASKKTHPTVPLCFTCGHGPIEHSLIGIGTCSGGSCVCVRFVFPKAA